MAEQALAVKQDSMPEKVVTQAQSMLAVIERAARDPAVDVEKLERLMAMAERIRSHDAEQAFNAALTDAQSEIGRISADAQNPQTRSTYASYAALDRVLRPIYTKHGFALSFDTGADAAPDHVRVLCHVSHRGGHKQTYRVDMPADGKGAKGGDVMTKTHAVGAAMSYGSRYLLKLIFNVAVGEDDKDGNDPAASVTINEEQFAEIQSLMEKANADPEKFAKYMKVDAIKDIRLKDLPRARESLNLAIDQLQRKRSAKP